MALPHHLLATLLLSFALVASAAAQETGRTAFTIVSASEGADYIWREEGRSARNPTLVVAPNEAITIVAKKGDDAPGIPHNLRVGPESAPTSETFADPGESITYTFTSLASGTQTYVCVIHPTTMKGTVRVAGTTVTQEREGAPGLGVLGALVAIAALAVALRRGRAR